MVTIRCDSVVEKLKFTLYAEPIAQGRPRLSSHGGFARAYAPPKSKNWKAYVADHARKAMLESDLDKPMDGPLCVRARFAFPLPKSHWRKRTPRPKQWHVKRPDLDNLYKGVVDACEGIVFHRDSQVCKVVMDKIIVAQGDGPYVSIQFERFEELNDA